MIVGLGHVDLVCRDVERSIAFYRAVLGLGEPAIFAGERGEPIHHLRFPASGSGSLVSTRTASGSKLRPRATHV